MGNYAGIYQTSKRKMGIKQKNPGNGRDLQSTHSLVIFPEDQALI